MFIYMKKDTQIIVNSSHLYLNNYLISQIKTSFLTFPKPVILTFVRRSYTSVIQFLVLTRVSYFIGKKNVLGESISKTCHINLCLKKEHFRNSIPGIQDCASMKSQQVADNFSYWTFLVSTGFLCQSRCIHMSFKYLQVKYLLRIKWFIYICQHTYA